MNKQYFRKKLKKIKKKWPLGLRPFILPTGELRIVRSMQTHDLEKAGINTVEDLFRHEKQLEKNMISNKEEKVVQDLIRLVKDVSQADMPPDITLPIMDEFFPGILERISV